MRILVADDSKTNLTLITSALNNLGHEVVAVSSGREAVEKFLDETPDLVILDVVMQEMNGFECAKQIRNLNTENWIPIIFLSGSVDDTSISQGINAGGDDYISKPFSAITLAAKIKAMQRIADMRKKLCEAKKLQTDNDNLKTIINHSHKKNNQPNTFKVLNCMTNNSNISIKLNSIRKIVPIAELVPIPNSQEYVVGMLNLAGKSIPVLDLSLRLNMPRNEKYTLETPIIICHRELDELSIETGLIVDKILDISEVRTLDIQQKDVEVDRNDKYFSASVTTNNGLSFLLNVENVLDTGLFDHIQAQEAKL